MSDQWKDIRDSTAPLRVGWRGLTGLVGFGVKTYQLSHQVRANNEAQKQYEEAELQRQRNAENDARIKKSFADAERARQEIERMAVPDALGDGRLGDLQDAQDDGLLDHNGLFLGALNGTPLFYNGDAHLLNYGLTRSGKGVTLVLTNLAHVFNRSIVVNDIKDGENAYATADYRESQGHKIICLNPHNVDIGGRRSYRLNPFQRIINKAQCGETVGEDALQICMSLVPPGHGDNAWVSEGAQQILATWLEWCACFYPDNCTLSNMWRFVFKTFDEDLSLMLDSQNEKLESQAEKINGFREAEKQWQAYQSKLVNALWNFAPDSPLAQATDATDFNPADIRNEKTTVYLIGDSDVLEASQQWVALTMSAMVNMCAQTPGQYTSTFIIDEMANLPYMAILPKALTMYAGKGVQLFGLCQGREALKAKGYKDHDIKNFEAQSGVLSMWSIKETDLLQDIEKWSGNKTVAVKGINQGGGQVESGGLGLSQQKRPVLQTEDIIKVSDGRQILRTNGQHLYIAERIPWYEVEGWKTSLKDPRPEHRYKNPA